MSTVTIGAFSAQYQTAYPYGYDGAAEDGLTARRWAFTCVLAPAETAALQAEYDAWRDLKIAERDPVATGVVGATVALTAVTDTASASGLACWFTEPPSIRDAGVFKEVSFTLVDAAQALAAQQAEIKKAEQVPGTVTIGGFSSSYLSAYPYTYEGEARTGRTARRWVFTAILTPAEEASLVSVYDTWRTARIADEDSRTSKVVGSTVSLTVSGLDAGNVSGLACWFVRPPEGQKSGAFKKVTWEVVDAAQALEVLLLDEDDSNQVPGTVTIGAFSSSYLSAYPYAYEGEARYGRTARRWAFSAILTPAEEASLVSVYDTWRTTRITDEDTLKSQVVGTTVSLTVTGLDAGNVSGLAVWFSRAPESRKVGAFKETTWEVVDAAQALEVLLKEQQAQAEQGEALEGDYGTLTLGSTILTLLQPMETFEGGPQLELLATGQHRVTGVQDFVRARNIQGRTDATGWAGILSWYESTVQATISAGAWFPVTPPTATGDAVLQDGVKVTRYTVSLRLVEVV